MLKITLSMFSALLLVGTAQARYNPPSNYITNSQKAAMYQMNLYDSDQDGRLSVDEFKNKGQVAETRETRRQKRLAQKEGIYQQPDEQFKTIDTNEDGYITLKELETYISNQTQKTKGKIKYY